MRSVLLYADFRSPHALNWARSVHSAGWSVTGVSSKRLEISSQELLKTVPLDKIYIPSDPASMIRHAFRPSNLSLDQTSRLTMPLISPNNHGTSVRTRSADWIDRASVPFQVRQLRLAIRDTRPDVVHALRIPYEGIIASRAARESPLILSSWGQDFVVQAKGDAWIGSRSRTALTEAEGLTADCRRDAAIAKRLGYTGLDPLIVPGNGGVDTQIFRRSARSAHGERLRNSLGIDSDRVVITNPRGLRSFVRTNEFLRAVAILVPSHRELLAFAVNASPDIRLLHLVGELGIEDNVRIGDRLTQMELADLLSISDIVCSPSTSDGTPNSLLEAMVMGCYVVAGDIDSVREWIKPGVNGELVDPTDPASIAHGLERALRVVANDTSHINSQLHDRVSRTTVGKLIVAYYEHILTYYPSGGNASP